MTNLCPCTCRVRPLKQQASLPRFVFMQEPCSPKAHWCLIHFSVVNGLSLPLSLSPHHHCSSEIKWMLMIGFYIKPAGMERELDRKLFWRPEVNMTNLSHFIFPPAPSIHHTNTVRAHVLWGPFLRVMWDVKHSAAFLTCFFGLSVYCSNSGFHCSKT